MGGGDGRWWCVSGEVADDSWMYLFFQVLFFFLAEKVGGNDFGVAVFDAQRRLSRSG